ncbi:hypothetical protein B0H16DRAFT_1886098 [Mycena metata]|uniref:DUF6924 domain-containing protein n=1 Tax=Mycena metata TaxID=1033252 RepID=A0AAD7J2L3_9AGAR|nr:hypothetical protein B0H16DRAFT_1886098 [Mycena metata]
MGVFVTAAKPQPKALNRAFLLIQDFEHADYPEDSHWTLITSKEAPSDVPPATVLPIPDISDNNAFTLSSMAEINTFIRQNEDLMTKMGVLVERPGLLSIRRGSRRRRALSANRSTSSRSAGRAEFRACRLPYEEASSMIVNLDMANMDFEDFVDEDAGEQEDGSWMWMSFPPSTKDTEEESEGEAKREVALKELRDGGYAD